MSQMVKDSHTANLKKHKKGYISVCILNIELKFNLVVAENHLQHIFYH